MAVHENCLALYASEMLKSKISVWRLSAQLVMSTAAAPSFNEEALASVISGRSDDAEMRQINAIHHCASRAKPHTVPLSWNRAGSLPIVSSLGRKAKK